MYVIFDCDYDRMEHEVTKQQTNKIAKLEHVLQTGVQEQDEVHDDNKTRKQT